MKPISTEIKVGIFTTMSTLVIAYMFFFLNPDSFQKRKKKNYYTTVNNASGVLEKTHLKTNGIIVGKITKVTLLASKARLDFEVDQSLIIPVGSRIAIKEKGLLGDVFVEIIRSENKGLHLKNGDLIPAAQDTANLADMVKIAGSVGNNLEKITLSLANIIGTEEGKQDIKTIIISLKETLETTNNIIKENKRNINTSLSNINKITQSIHSLVSEENRKKIKSSIHSINEISNKLNSVTNNISNITSKINKGEGTIGRLVNDDTVLVELEDAIYSAKNLLDPINKLQVSVDYHGELRQTQDVQHYFNLIFKTRPDKYYLLGFTDLYESIKETTTETSGTTTNEKKKETVLEKKSLRLNAQFAKRWGPIQLRFGLFETTGGFASDIFLINDRIKWSTEVFNWNRWSQNEKTRKIAYIKSYLSLSLLKNLYFTTGITDLTKLKSGSNQIDTKFNWFIGAGLYFSDDDFKTMIGASSLAF